MLTAWWKFWQFRPAMKRPSVENIHRPCFLNHRTPTCGPITWFSAVVYHELSERKDGTVSEPEVLPLELVDVLEVAVVFGASPAWTPN